MNQTATQSTATAGKPPLAPGLPVLGNALSMRIDPLAYLLGLYREYGPVFRVRMLGRKLRGALREGFGVGEIVWHLRDVEPARLID